MYLAPHSPALLHRYEAERLGLFPHGHGGTKFNRLNSAFYLGVVTIRNFLVRGNRSAHSIVDDNPVICASRFSVRDCVLSAIKHGSRAQRGREGAIFDAEAS